MAFLTELLVSSWHIMLEAAPYMLLGFFVAGLLKAFVPAELVSKHLGTGRVAPVFKAALFGIPLPLCSCGVIPAAAGLRKQGASKGATTAFLIATPETGVDSIAITWALLDPVMTVLRPVFALITSITAGLLVDFFPERANKDEKQAEEDATAVLEKTSSCCSTAVKESVPTADGNHASRLFAAPLTSLTKEEATTTSCGCSCGSKKESPTASAPSIGQRFMTGMRFAFGTLIGDIGGWFLFGLLLASLISFFLPDDILSGNIGSGIFLMMVIGIPMYVCATASTPIAAAFALKGISPGAALVFLLAGPATNVATITVVARMLGKKAAFIYVATIGILSVLLGLAVNYLYIKMGFNIGSWVQGSLHDETGLLSQIAAVILLALIVWQWGSRQWTKYVGTRGIAKQSSCCGN